MAWIYSSRRWRTITREVNTILQDAIDALRTARDALGEPERYSRGWQRHRALESEIRLLAVPTIWPVLTPAQRQEIITDGFHTGRYRQHGEPDPARLICTRRTPLWRALLDPDAPSFVLSAARLVRPDQLLRRPTDGLTAEAITAGLLSGEIWAWCDEGWRISRFDVRRVAGRWP